MLARERHWSAMHSGLRDDLVAADGPLAGQTLQTVEPVSGGCIHQAWSLTLDGGQRLFAKSGGPEAMALFRVEAEALEALHDFADPKLLVVPRPRAIAQLTHGSVLLLPWLDLGGGDQRALGRGLARLHRSSAEASPAALAGIGTGSSEQDRSLVDGRTLGVIASLSCAWCRS